MTTEVLTTDQIARQYAAALDSVNLVNDLLSREFLSLEDQQTLDRNVGHLRIMLDKDFWTTEDLSPFEAAITAADLHTSA